jgi:hypothetical protein
VLIAVVICSLTVSLATRFTAQASASPVHAVKSLERRSVDTKRQHFNRAVGLADVPARATAFAAVVLLYVPIAQADPILPSAPADQSLYNRPPPSSSTIL